MFKRTLLLATLALSTSFASAAEAPLTLGEQFKLRAQAGHLESAVLSNVLKAKSVGVAVNNATICVSLAGALAGEYQASNPNNPLDIIAFTKPGDATQVPSRFLDKDAVALLFGGQEREEESAASVNALLKELAKANYKGAIFLHVTTFGKKWVEQAAGKDAAIASYLAGKNNIYALNVNIEQKKGIINQISYKEGKQTVGAVAFDTALGDGFMDLFTRRLIPAQ